MKETRHISTFIHCAPQKVYDFVRNPSNLPLWARGLSGTIQKIGEDWIADSPMGRVKVEFTPQNEFGILDHFVTLENGLKFYNPLRVFANDDGSEIVFTLFRAENMTAEKFDEDEKWVRGDLLILKKLMEK